MAGRLVSAVVGCGRMGAFTSDLMRRYAPDCLHPLNHCEAISACPDLQLTAVCDPDLSAVARAREQYGVLRTFTDYRELLRLARPDLLSVATRTLGRAAIIGDALDAGVRALHVEKPLCNSVAELAQLERQLASDGVALTLGAIRRHLRVYRQAMALACSRRYGQLLEVRVNMGRGTLYWVHPHSVDLLLFVAGDRRVLGVQAKLANVQRRGMIIESDPEIVSATVYFADDLVGHIGRAPGSDLMLACAGGEVAVENDGHLLTIRATADDNPYPQRQFGEKAPAGGPEGTLAALRELVGCLKGEPECLDRNRRTRADTLLGQRLLFAMVQSHLQDAKLVAVDEVDPDLVVQAASGGRYA